MPQALSHYQRLNLDFSCVYSGFLGSEAQIDHCLAFFQAYPDALAVVDPVMGDHGRAYRTVTEGMRRRMIELVGIADIISPNLTEACILLGEPYNPMPLTRAQAKSMRAGLSEKGPKKIVITGVSLAEGNMANIGYDQQHNYYCLLYTSRSFCSFQRHRTVLHSGKSLHLK